MNTEDETTLDDLFHGCAFAAFIHQAIQQRGPPDEEATRKRAMQYYEKALAQKNAQRDEILWPTA